MKIFFVKCQKGEKSVLPTFEKPIWTLMELIKMKLVNSLAISTSFSLVKLTVEFTNCLV